MIGQVTLGLLVGSVLYFHPQFSDIKTLTYLPFVADETLDYNILRHWFTGVDLGWVIYIPIVIFILTALSNAVNLTDGLDGLAAGVTGIVAVGLTALAYIAGNAIFSDFLNEMMLPGAGELTVFAAALAASCFGFLWYNGYPASVFMGDTGALSLGAAVGTMALMVKRSCCFRYCVRSSSGRPSRSSFRPRTSSTPAASMGKASASSRWRPSIITTRPRGGTKRKLSCGSG